MLGGEFLAGNGRRGSFAGESNRNALLVASTLPMVAYAMRTRLLPLVLAVPILVMLLWGLVLSASFTGFIGAIGALAIFFVVGGIRPSPKIIALMAAVVAVLYMRDRKSTRLHSSPYCASRIPSSAFKTKITQ